MSLISNLRGARSEAISIGHLDVDAHKESKP